MKLSFLKVLVIITIFSTVTTFAYIHRGDYFHKQTDQFYYLSLADSLRLDGVMKARVDLELSPVPRTANTGVTWLMLPFSTLSMDKVFSIVSIIYLLLGLISFFPLYKVLRAFKVSEENCYWILLVFGCTFPMAQIKTLPVNEGASLFLVSWFLYFTFVKPSFLKYILGALSSIFRAHIFILSISLIIYNLLRKKKTETLESVGSFGASVGGLLIYRQIFPFTQGSGTDWSQFHFWGFLKQYFEALTHLFVPESVFQTLLHRQSDLFAIIFGLGVFVLFLIIFYKGIKKSNAFILFSCIVFFVNFLSVASWPAIVSRFLVTIFFWGIAVLILSLAEKPRVLKWSVCGYILVQSIFLVFFSVTKSKDPSYALLEKIKSLSQTNPLGKTIFYEEDFPAHGRLIYGPFRKPVRFISSLNDQEKQFAILTLKPYLYANSFKNCRTRAVRADDLFLLDLSCP